MGFGVVLGVWSVLSYGGVYDEPFLPSPTTVEAAGYDLFANYGFAYDVWASTYRMLVGFVISALIGIPLGIAIASFRSVQAFFEPVIAFVRYMPASAFIPLLIIRFGTYQIVAELVAAERGIGHVILRQAASSTPIRSSRGSSSSV